MKRFWHFLLLLAACTAALAGHAEDAQDSESALRALLTRETGSDGIVVFEYGDYDGDGAHEAFALLSNRGWSGDDEGVTGAVWFVSPAGCVKLRDEDSYLMLGKKGVGPTLFAAEVWYGGSGSSSVVWGVRQGVAVQISGNGFEGFGSEDVPNEFYMYPSAFDMSPDGTGHTWKRYYFFLDGLELKEYGGIRISRSQLEEADGAKAILQSAEAEGWTIGDIYYRANGIINVNLKDNRSNDNLTLRLEGSAVVDTGERYGGVYSAESGLVSAVDYPDSFDREAPSTRRAEPAAAEPIVSGKTAESGTRAQILQARGILSTDAFMNVTGVDFSDAGENQKLRVRFTDEVFIGGSEGYWEDWLTASGAVSEAYADLDGDGADEYILLYLVSQQAGDGEYSFWNHIWNLAIYESDGAVLNLACEFPISLYSSGERFVRLLNTGSGSRIMVSGIGYWDGGTAGITTTLYGYDGKQAYIDMIMNATVGENSFIAFGPFDVGNGEQLYEALEHAKYDQSALSKYGLVEGRNCEFHWPDYETEGPVSVWNEQYTGNTLNAKAFTGFEKITQAAKKYGVIAGFSFRQQKDDEYSYESFTLKVLGGDMTLLWASEGWDETVGQSYIDIIVHYTEQPILR